MSIKEWLCRWAQRNCPDPSTTMPIPEFMGRLQGEQLLGYLCPVFRHAYIGVSDKTFKCPTLLSVKAFLDWDKTDIPTYTGDPGRDCDDYAFHLMGQFQRGRWCQAAVGIMWANFQGRGQHAFNLVSIVSEGGAFIYYIEPQDDTIKPFTADMVDNVQMVIF